jgi:hypothetical protein
MHPGPFKPVRRDLIGSLRANDVSAIDWFDGAERVPVPVRVVITYPTHAGEIKKSVFTAMNHLLPFRDVDRGVCRFESVCYAKTIRLSRGPEPHELGNWII